MFNILKQNTRLGLFLNIGSILLVFAIIVLLFFYTYLPFTTNHGETLKVPDVIGKSEAEMADIFKTHSLRYQVIDSAESDGVPLGTVISQHPNANSEVKFNRKIYIIMNKTQKGQRKIPNVLYSSVRNAQSQLEGADLVLGKTKEVPSQFKGNVVGIMVNNKELSIKEIKTGYMVDKGQVIDLLVGSGRGAPKDEELDESIDEIPD